MGVYGVVTWRRGWAILQTHYSPSALDRGVRDEDWGVAGAAWGVRVDCRFKGCVRSGLCLVKCKRAAPGRSAGGTWLQASSSCGSETVPNRTKHSIWMDVWMHPEHFQKKEGISVQSLITLFKGYILTIVKCKCLSILSDFPSLSAALSPQPIGG